MIKKEMFKKILSVLLLALVLFSFVFAPVARAQDSTWYDQSLESWYTKVYDKDTPNEIFGERYTAAQVNWIIWSVLTWLPTKVVGPEVMSCILSGEVSNCGDALAPSPGQSSQLQNTGEKQTLAEAFFEERPISLITYTKDVGRRLNFVPEAEAQEGFGFQSGLTPILPMWRSVRDIAYGLVVLAIVILAFMIMFRVKISPQIVITVQSAIPKVALGLILITFSYAIAGFLIDLMYVVIGVISLFGTSFLPFKLETVDVFNFLTKGQMWFSDRQWGAFALAVMYIILFVVALLLGIFSYIGLVGAAVVGVLGVAIASAASITGPLFAIIALVITAIVTIILLWMSIKIFWTLLKAYASVLLLTIFAPIQFLIGIVVPGFGFSNWLRSFVSKLAVFIGVGLLFLLSFSFLFQGIILAWDGLFGGNFVEGFLNVIFGSSSIDIIQNETSASWPPLLGLGGKAGTSLLFLGVSFVIFTIIPKTAEVISSLIEGKPFAYGSAIDTMFAPVTTIWGSDTARAFRETMGRERTKNILQKIVDSDKVPPRYTKMAENILGSTKKP